VSRDAQYAKRDIQVPLLPSLIIGHLKSDHQLKLNVLKGFTGDQINLLTAAAAFNFKKWM